MSHEHSLNTEPLQKRLVDMNFHRADVQGPCIKSPAHVDPGASHQASTHPDACFPGSSIADGFARPSSCQQTQHTVPQGFCAFLHLAELPFREMLECAMSQVVKHTGYHIRGRCVLSFSGVFRQEQYVPSNNYGS